MKVAIVVMPFLAVDRPSLAAGLLSVVIGALSQGFGGVYQDRLACADYLERHRIRPLPAVPCQHKGTGS